jgi:hypothetical protein
MRKSVCFSAAIDSTEAVATAQSAVCTCRRTSILLVHPRTALRSCVTALWQPYTCFPPMIRC